MLTLPTVSPRCTFWYGLNVVAIIFSMVLLMLIKGRLASVLKIEKCRHADAKNSKLGGKNKEPFLFIGGDEEKESTNIQNHLYRR